jgi:hypothetical protein
MPPEPGVAPSSDWAIIRAHPVLTRASSTTAPMAVNAVFIALLLCVERCCRSPSGVVAA